MDRLVTLRGARGSRVARIAPPSGWAMAAFFYRDGRRELRRVPIPAPEIIRVVANFGAMRPVIYDMQAPSKATGLHPPLQFRLRRALRGARLIYDEVA